jgi:hypothetical protein
LRPAADEVDDFTRPVAAAFDARLQPGH